MPDPAVQIQAHLGGVVSLGVDPSSTGRYMSTCGRDGTVKIWDCRNWKGVVREWTLRGAGGNGELEWSQRGMLSVASGGTVNVCYLLFP
jgi:U3 small nucleolar RNA-associated protein 7